MNTEPSPTLSPDVAHRRLRLLRISPELFLDLFSAGDHTGYKVVDHAVPSGTRLVNVRFGWPVWIELLIEHESFAELAPGATIPLLAPLLSVLGYEKGDTEVTIGDPPWGICNTDHFPGTTAKQIRHERHATCQSWEVR